MASATLNESERWAPGVLLGAYPTALLFSWSGAPPAGSAITTATVGAAGTVTFNGLVDGTRYFAAKADGAGGYVLFSTDAAAPAGGGGGGSGTVAPLIVNPSGGSLGANVTLALDASRETWLYGTLDNSLVVTATPVAGAVAWLKLIQAGAMTLVVNDGLGLAASVQNVPIAGGVGESVEVMLSCPGVNDLVVTVLGAAGPAGVDGVSGATVNVDGAPVAVASFSSQVEPADVGAIGSPIHPLGYRVVGTRAGVLNNAGLSAAGVGTNSHDRVRFPYGARRVGIVYANVYSLFPSGLDGVTTDSINIRASLGKIGTGEVPAQAIPGLWWDAANKRAQYVNGEDNTTYTLAPSDAVIFDTGETVEVGGERWINTYAIGSQANGTPNGTEVLALFETPTYSSGTRAEGTSSSVAETDGTAATSGTWSATVSAKSFRPVAIVDLESTGSSWEACMVAGDSLHAGVTGGMQVALGSDDVPFTCVARSTESLHTFLAWVTGANLAYSVARRGAMSRPRASFAAVQYFTNDANLNSPTQVLSGTGTGSWQKKQRDFNRWLARRGIHKVAWATVPPNTASTDSWATLAGQSLVMLGRGPRQQVMQDWNAYLRSGALLYTNVSEGWSIYAPPSGQGFGTGSVTFDPWAPVTVLEAVNTSVVTSGDAAGYAFSGAPILKWVPGITNDGLHDHANGAVRALGIRGLFRYMKGELV